MNYTFFLSLSVLLSSVLWGNGLWNGPRGEDEPAYVLLMQQIAKELTEPSEKKFINDFRFEMGGFIGKVALYDSRKQQVGYKVRYSVNPAELLFCNPTEVQKKLQHSLDQEYSDFFMVNKKVVHTGKTIELQVIDSSFEFEQYLKKALSSEQKEQVIKLNSSL